MTLNNRFKKSALALIVMGSFPIAHAQEEAKDVEVIQVSGIRGSLQSAMNVKKNSSGVVDAISAEDIGKFPDTNLAESLQRITGVSIDRSNNEGNQVTVRGFGPSFNLVTLNGRQMPNSSALESAGVSRSFNFRELAAESVSGVEVYKTGKAYVPSGGLGATINIKTAKPFDYDGFVAMVSAKAVMDTSVDKGDDVTPEFSGMISNRFADGKLGVLASFSHSERDSHVDRIGTQGWGTGYPGQANPDTSAIDTSLNPTLTTWRTTTVDLEKSDYSRERQNGQLVVQYQATDTFKAAIDYTMSRLDERGEMNRMSFWFDNVETGAADVNGTIINPTRTNDELNFWAWEYAFKTENDSIGVNFDWQATESLRFKLDAHDSTSHANPGALPAERLANLKNPFGDAAPVTISADFSTNTPTVSYDDSALIGGAYALDNIEGDLYQERGYEIENNIKQVQFDGIWYNMEDGALDSIKFGLSQTTYKVDTNKITSSNFALGNGAMDISALDLSFAPGAIGFESFPLFSAEQFIDLVDEQGLRNPTSNNMNGIEEETNAAYLAFDFVSEFNGMEFKANIGVRYEQTDVSSYSITNPVVGFNWITPLQMEEIFADETYTETLDGDYDHYLPNLDFSLNISDDLVTRFSYSRTIARSDISAMFPATSLNEYYSTG
ncbi:TonB-dependent receptor, partial [Alteromonas sp. 14N.309.X.WAT.G.H12]|uniref:TonB-dependent receptor n=1 Tax=Alteromonas sp. 14N.309.X.WAT.G.H12 TaxID=3120824 RepID=UPI002FD7678C